jgi:hypothetical protein
MRFRVVFAVSVRLLLAAALVSSLRSFGSQATAQAGRPQAIPAPTDWVAFDASMRKRSKEGPVFGRYYRRSDGSTRWDTGPAENDMRVISISNVSNSEHYEYARGTWKSYRMILPPGGYRPKRRSFQTTKGLEPWSTRIQGFEVIRQSTNSELVRYVAPALNFFALLSELDDTRQEFFDVRVREQPSQLFSPARDAKVVMQTEYRGIVSESSAKAAGISIDMESRHGAHRTP